MRGEDRRVLAADHAAAHDDHAFRNAVHREDGIGIEDGFVVKRNFRRAVRLRAGGDQDHFAAQGRAAPCWICDVDGVRVFKTAPRRG